MLNSLHLSESIAERRYLDRRRPGAGGRAAEGPEAHDRRRRAARDHQPHHHPADRRVRREQRQQHRTAPSRPARWRPSSASRSTRFSPERRTGQTAPSMPRRSALRIADTTGGKFFRAQNDADALKQIFAEIDQLERTRVEERRFVRWGELSHAWLLAAFVLRRPANGARGDAPEEDPVSDLEFDDLRWLHLLWARARSSGGGHLRHLAATPRAADVRVAESARTSGAAYGMGAAEFGAADAGGAVP